MQHPFSYACNSLDLKELVRSFITFPQHDCDYTCFDCHTFGAVYVVFVLSKMFFIGAAQSEEYILSILVDPKTKYSVGLLTLLSMMVLQLWWEAGMWLPYQPGAIMHRRGGGINWFWLRYNNIGREGYIILRQGWFYLN